MTSQPGKRTVAIHILTSISRSKYNQTIKFRQLIACNLRKTFLEKTSKDYISEHISESITQSFIQFVFIVCQIEGYCSKDIKTKLQVTCFYPISSLI